MWWWWWWWWWPPGFWDALLLTIWLAFAGLIIIFGLAARVAPHYAWSETVIPLASGAFVSLSVARFIALRTRPNFWVVHLGVGQVLASIVVNAMDTRLGSASRPWIKGAVEHWLVGSAVAMVLFALFSFWSFIRWRRTRVPVVGPNALTRALLVQRRQAVAVMSHQ